MNEASLVMHEWYNARV